LLNSLHRFSNIYSVCVCETLQVCQQHWTFETRRGLAREHFIVPISSSTYSKVTSVADMPCARCQKCLYWVGWLTGVRTDSPTSDRTLVQHSLKHMQ